MANYDLILTNGTIVNHAGIGRFDIAIMNEKIVALGDLSQKSAKKIIDCKGLHILPGVIDTQVHFREPGLTHKEDLRSGSLAAVMGGVTGVFEMPNTKPLTITKEAFEDKISRASDNMHCDFAFFIGGTHENVDKLPMLEKLPGCAGVKVFMGSSTGSLLVADDEGVRAILNAISRRAAFHSEDEYRLEERKNLRVENDVSSHPIWRDEEVALNSTKRLVRLAHETGKQIHILHISTKQEMEFLSQHKDIASLEVTPHHLTLDAKYYQTHGSLIQMNPPVRDISHQKGLWWGLKNGVVDILGSDHAPHTLEEKNQPYPKSPSGMTGVETLVPIMLDHVNRGRLTLEHFVDLTSHAPNRLFGLTTKGRLAVGYDGDLTIIDLKKEKIITNSELSSRAGWSPYDGKKVKGWPVGTIIRGNIVCWEGELITPNIGRPIKFQREVQK